MRTAPAARNIPGMARRIGWFVFIALAGWLLLASTYELIPATRREKDAFQQIARNGVDETAVVVGKREEEVYSNGDVVYRFYVTLEHTQGGKAFRRELPYLHMGLLREDWNRIAVGDTVSIRAMPDDPLAFYAPDYLPAEGLSKTVIDYWLYVLFSAVVVVLLGWLLYSKVLRAPLPPPRTGM